MLLDKIKKSKAFTINVSDYSWWVYPFIFIYRLFSVIVIFLLWLIGSIVAAIVSLCRQYRWARIVTALLATFIVVGIIDYIAFYGKIYPGVQVADIDLGNKTVDEATDIIESTLSPRLSSNTITVFSSNQAQELGVDGVDNASLNEELSMSDAKNTIQYWNTNAIELEATLPAADISNLAYQTDRGLQNIFSRIGALMFGHKINPWATYNKDAITSQTNKINSILGDEVVNPNVTITDGIATAQQGKDGNLVLASDYESQLNEAFFQADPANSNFVAQVKTVKQKVSYNAAQLLANKVNQALNCTVKLSYQNYEWDIDRVTLGDMLSISFSSQEETFTHGCSSSVQDANAISASVTTDSVFGLITSWLKDSSVFDNLTVQIENNGGKYVVKTSGEGQIPLFSNVSEQLNQDVFSDCVVVDNNITDNDVKNSTVSLSGSDNETAKTANIEIRQTKVPEVLTLEEAQALGIIIPVASYTTSYSTGAGTENRNFNIELVSSKLNGSICKADGGSWSFNGIAGNCDETAGFLQAGTVEGGKIVKSAGGGICQVATTIFNCIYESGFEITSRSPHGMHIASYPAGRDAAISYPLPDLTWRNSSNSDVMLIVTTTGYSVTATLYGIHYGYTVKSEVGDWTEEGDYKTEVVVDPSKKENSSFIQTAGSKGKSISVKRKVYDKSGKLIREDTFVSNYKPKTEIRVIGPGEEANKLLAEKQARMKEANDNW